MKEESPVRNAYPDEQDKINNEFQSRLELGLKIEGLLRDYGYSMVAKLDNGLPYVDIVKD